MSDELLVEPAMLEVSGAADLSSVSTMPEGLAAVEFARRVLTRRPIRKRQNIVFDELEAAYPGWVSRDELCAATGYRPHQLAGLMGAFGRRTARTEGYVDGASLFETEWDTEASAYRYRLSESAYQALQSRR